MKNFLQLCWFVLLTMLPFFAMGQYGPMGIGNADGTESPVGFPQPRLLLWLDGSSSATQTNGSTVNSWNDRSGNGHHFTATGSNRPIFRTTGGPSGESYLDFDGIDDRMMCTSFDFSGSEYSIYFVVKTSDANYGVFSYAESDLEPDEMLVYNNGGIRQKLGANDRSSSVGNLSNGDWNYGGIVWDNSPSILWEYNDSNQNEATTSFGSGYTISSGGTAVIGDVQTLLGGGFLGPDAFDGQIAEIIVFEGALNRPQTRLMRTYLWTKYGEDFNNGNTGWDKFRRFASGSGGKYYNPIGAGRDNNTPNPGEHDEARNLGLVIRVSPGEWTQTSYLCAGNDGVTNSIVTTNLPAGVDARWNTTWEINGDGGTSQRFKVGFDFGEGIGGDIPQVAENFVLLSRTGTSGTFAEFPSGNIIETAIIDDEVVFTILKGNIDITNKYYTIGTKDGLISTLDGSEVRTWYAYQTGNWSNSTTWTLDGSAAPAYVNPSAAIPATGDKIYIGSGRTVTVDVDGLHQGSLRVFGTLDVASATAPTFLSIAGSGVIKCAGNGGAGNFPIGNSTAFADAVNGGTAIFYGSGGFTQSTEVVVNKLKINFGSSANVMTLSANLTHNGLFEINKGRLEINNTSSSLTITSNDRVLVENLGFIQMSSDGGAREHTWNFQKDFIIDGDVRFTRRTTPNYTDNETNQYIQARFISGTGNQELRVNKIGYFSRIVVNKGVDMTYILTINSNGSNKFKLLGPCDDPIGSDIDTWAESGNDNSCALVNGTLEVGQNIFIPLSTGSGNYNLAKSVMLWVNGGEVAKGAPEVGPGNQTAIVVYGAVKVSGGILKANCQSGLTTRQNGLVQIDGGTIYANSIRTSNQGTENIGGLIINGGLVDLDGNRDGNVNNEYYTFSLTYPGNLFRMTGGEMRLTGPSSKGLLFINSDPENTSVTGGEVIIDVSTTEDRYYLSSRAAFWDLTIKRSSTSGTNRSVYVRGGSSGSGGEQATMENQDLVVRNNLSILGSNSPTLQMGTGAFTADLYLHSNLTIEDGAVYGHNSNTTRFVGNSNSFLTLRGQTKFFNNVEVNKDTDVRYAKIQPTSVTIPMDVLGNFNLEKGYFDHGGEIAEVKGNIVNRSQFGVDGGVGYIRMNGSAGRQEIFSDNGVFQKLAIDNLDGVELKNDGLTINTWIKLEDGSFFIGDNKLRLKSVSPYLTFSSSKFIVCSGNASAGGVEILNSVDGQLMEYRFGVNSPSGQKYTPAFVNINSGFVDDGYIRITPVDTVMPTSDASGGANFLNYYWRVNQSGYSDLPNVTHRFQYNEDDIRGLESNYVSGRVLSVLPFERNVDGLPIPDTDHVNTTSNTIYYNGTDVAQSTSGNGTLLLNADYSAGDALRFSGSPQVFYSKNDGVGAAWDVAANWNELSTFGGSDDIYDYHSSSGPVQSDFPEGGDIAIIGFDVDNSSRKPHVYKAPSGGIEASVVAFTPLQDPSFNRLPRYMEAGSSNLGILRPTLQISATADILKVQQITGEGELWLENDIDLGVTDIGGFLSEDSSVVVLAPSLSKIFNFLPANVPNLFLANSTLISSTLTSDITVRGDLEIAGQSQLFLSTTASGNITVNGDLILDKYQSTSSNSKVLYRRGNSHRTVTVKGDLKILGSGSIVDISTIGSPPVVPIPWTPDEVGALLWLDADDASTITVDGGNKVIDWDNKASGSFNSTQSDSGKRPNYQASGLNGKNTVRFDGSDDFLSIAHNNALNMLAGQDFEIFSVIKQNAGSSYQAIYAKGEVAPTDFLLYMPTDEKYKLYVDQAKIDMTAPTGMASYANMGWARRQGNNGQLYNTRSGNQSQSGVSNATNLGNTHTVSIGAADDGNSRHFDGDIAEIILVKRALTEDERNQMEGYLAHKWGLEGDLPGSHPYKTTSPLIGGQISNLPNQLIVEGDIIQSTTGTVGLDLYLPTITFPTDTSFVNLIVRGTGNHKYNKISGSTPKIWKLEVDKGIDLVSSFTINSDIDVFGPTDELEKPVELINGLLTLNNSAIDLTFSSGGGDFRIPESAGLELNDGNYEIIGDETGLLLEGSLKITGGTFEIGDTEGENNYIEYASSGLAKIIVEGGSLLVGSQVRRGLTNTAGILKYKQTGGDVTIGRYAAPAANRGMLEIVNTGSSFEHTDGTLTFVRGVNSSSTPSLLIESPTISDVSGSSIITIGNADSPAGAQIQNFGIKSSIPLNTLNINNASTNDPVVNLISLGLELNNDLTIASGATMNCGNQNLEIYGDISNDGILSSSSSLVTLNHSSLGSVSGTGIFDLFNLERIGGSGGLTSVETDLLVNNDFTLDGGTIGFDSNTLTVKGDVVADGEITFAPLSDGLIFNGDDEQKLDRTDNGTTVINTITIDNSDGVVMTNGAGYRFVIDEKLRLSKGVFKLQGNLLELGLDAETEEVNPYGELNMISTGGAFTNFGVLKNVYANSTEEIFIPVGIDKYMPVKLDFSQPGYSSGSTNSSFLFKLNIPEHPIRIDPNNVLGMYFSLDASNIGAGLNMEAQFQYDDSYVQTTGANTEADYIAARVYDGDVFKYGTGAVDESSHTITLGFSTGEAGIDGDYFAGINEAIPDIIPEYHTTTTGSVDDAIYDVAVPGGGAPSGSDVYIEDTDILVFDEDGINFYRTFITPDATLKIDATSFHRLGKVTGTGTIHLVGTGSLPSGEYNTFFQCFGGKLIYEGRNGDSFEILSSLPTVTKVDIIGHSGSSINFANNDVTICEDLTIDGPQVGGSDGALLTVDGTLNIEAGSFNMGQGDLLVEGNLNLLGGAATGGSFLGGNQGVATINGNFNLGGKLLNLGSVSRITEVKGNIEKSSGIISGGTGGARLKMAGSTHQYIEGNFVGTSKIPFLHIANPNGVTLYDNVEISDTLRLETGTLNTGIDSLVFLTLDDTDVDPIGGSPNSFVNGPMKWTLLSSSEERIFPIGKNDRYRPLRLSSRSANRTWEVEYYDTLARVQPAVTSMLVDPSNSPVIEEISVQEHWRVNHNLGGVSAKVSLSWGENSAVAGSPSDYNKLLVLSYNTATDVWDSYGGSGFTYNAGTSTGNFTSASSVSFSERFFTLGSSDGINPLPVTWLYFEGQTIDENHVLEWATASEKNNEYFELERSIDAQNWVPIAQIEGAGQSTSESTYSYTDRDAPYGRVYYRIKQVDFDGELDFYPNVVTLLKELKAESSIFDFVLYPNPTKYGTVKLMLPGYEDAIVEVWVTDMTGKTMSKQKIQIDGQGISQQIDCNFQPGIYLVTVLVNDKIKSKPLVISK